MGVGRSAMVEDIIALLKASTKTNLATLNDNAIQYGLRTFGQIFSVQYRKGIFVALSTGSLDPLTMGSVKQDLLQTVQILVYTLGHNPTTDAKFVTATLEEVEEVLWTGANLTLAHGGLLKGEPTADFGPPLGKHSLVLHWAVLEARYCKTMNL